MVTETSEDLKLMLDLGESWPELQHLEFRFFQKTPGYSDPRVFLPGRNSDTAGVLLGVFVFVFVFFSHL